ncbi:MAG: hypothetical protein M1816_004507 [Peltula sp. TS41687]|nr:MAG: hypothetical protein M1816_004507 [Peltula sp. TS41687]
MADTPKNIVIIGGSLAGLMHGVMAKRLGHNVHILEQSPQSHRAGHGAGITAGPQALEFFAEYDLYKEPFSIDCQGVQFIDRSSRVMRFWKRPMQMTSWSTLYYRLRANFDGLESEYCPEPPTVTEKEGRATYAPGKRVVDISETDGSVIVECEDLINGGRESFRGDLVIAADGSNSTSRRILLPEVRRPYAGYVAWRGTVPESEISEETRKIFDSRVTMHGMHRSYIVIYIIPGEQGSLQPGERLLNFVWYYNFDQKSDEFADIMTDKDGNRHLNTLPIGKLREEVWEKQKARGKLVMPPSVAELIDKTRQPFISSISDSIAPRASYFNGKLLLVGDAFALFRPHVALSANQAAMHCLLSKRLLEGEISVAEWEDHVTHYGNKTRLLSNVIGNYAQFGGWTFVATLFRYLLVLISQALPSLRK